MKYQKSASPITLWVEDVVEVTALKEYLADPVRRSSRTLQVRAYVHIDESMNPVSPPPPPYPEFDARKTICAWLLVLCGVMYISLVIAVIVLGVIDVMNKRRIQ
jgi:hypothetical protein